MKTNNFSNNLFSNKVAENQISKFSRSEFLSSSNQFKNLIKKSEEKDNEEKDKFKSKDIHQEKLNERLLKEKSSEQEGLLALLSSNQNVDQQDLFAKPEHELSLEDKNTRNKILEEIGSKPEIKKALADLEKLTSVDKLNKFEDDGKIKLDEKFKLQDNLKPDEKLKIQDSVKNTDLKGNNKLDHQKVSAQKAKLGLNSMDTKSKNEFKLQNTLRSKNIELKNKLGRTQAAKIYEQQQPVASEKIEAKKVEAADVNMSKVRRVKIARPLGVGKTNSDTLKNDLMSNTLDFEQKLEKSNNVQKNDFSKLMNLQDQFKTEGADDVVKQAQFLANKGGGEMKLLLNPRGLGELTLKVMMEQDQIKVEMLTDNADAKEIIEASLGDLRKALGDNQLQVDSITVDSLDNLKDLLADQDEQASKEFAQDFLSEFRQQNDEFRQGVLEFPAIKRRRSQIIEEGITTNSKSKDSSRRLDLVA